MFHLQLNRKTLYRNESLCLTQVCISAAHREKMIQNNLQRKTVEKKKKLLLERKVPRDLGRAKHAGYDNTEPKSPSVYCLGST